MGYGMQRTPCSTTAALRAHFADLLAVADSEPARRLPTPFALADVAAMRRNAARFRRPGVTLSLAVKALYRPELLAELAGEVDLFGVQSSYEAQLCPAGARLSFHSPRLDPLALADPRTAHVSLNSTAQCARVRMTFDTHAPRYGLRLALALTCERAFVRRGSKFGLDADALVAETRKGLPGGLAFVHHHSHARLHDREQAVEVADVFVAAVEHVSDRTGCPPRALDIGGGWDGGFELLLHGTSIEELLDLQLARLRELDSPPSEVIVEPGRALFEDAMIVVATVDEVRNGDGLAYAVVDVATGFLVPLELSRFRFVALDPEADARAMARVALVDGTCSPRGRIATQLSPAVRAGDRVAIVGVGAYTYSVAGHFFAPPAPLYRLAGAEPQSLIPLEPASR
jgi:diaminopimelate decarboxylase